MISQYEMFENSSNKIKRNSPKKLMVFTTIDSCKQIYIEVCVRDKPHDASVCIVLVRMQCAQIRRAIFSHIQREPL